MRLRRYITEATPAHFLHDLSRSISKSFRKMRNKLDSKNWNVTDKELIKILNKELNSDGIEVILKPKRGGKFKWIAEASFGGPKVKEGIPWQIALRPGIAEFIKRYSNPDKKKFFADTDTNQLAREILDSMSHEMLHAHQALRSNAMAFRTPGSTADYGEEAYLSTPIEIEANALSAAIDIWRFGKTQLIDRYREVLGKDNKAYKKFLKKLAFYLPQVKKSGLKSFKFSA